MGGRDGRRGKREEGRGRPGREGWLGGLLIDMRCLLREGDVC